MKALKNRKALERQAKLKHNPCYDVKGGLDVLLLLAFLVAGVFAITIQYVF